MPPNVLILRRKDAVEMARAATNQVRVPTDALVLHLFCDASYKHGSRIRRINPTAALAVVGNIWLPYAIDNQRTSKACFIPCNGPDDTNYTAEALALVEGAYVALDQIAQIEEGSTISPVDRVEIIFWSDCQTVLREIGNRRRPAGIPKKLRHVIDMIELKVLDIQRSRKNVFVQFFWCPQECVEPHFLADQLSKTVRMTGGGSESKALHLLHGLSHRAILSTLAQLQEPREEARQSESQQSESQQSEAEQSTDVSTTTLNTTDGYQIINSAASHIAAAKREMELADIKLQEMDNVLRVKGQDYEAAGQEYMVEDQSVNPQGQSYEQDGSPDEEEETFHDAKEIADMEDEDKFYDAREPADDDDGNVELAMAGGRVGRPSRVRALWDWMRGRPRL